MDYALGLKEKSDEENVEWLTEHHKRLEEAFCLASESTEKEALRHRNPHNEKADRAYLPVGA